MLIVFFTSVSAIACPEVLDMADAVIYAWYPGEQGGLALGDLLFGKEIPSGRLPITVPYSVDDLPPYEDYAMANRTYRYMEKEPLFPFGFGLSYTSFSYDELELSSHKVKTDQSLSLTVKITNTGQYEGEEVVQLYLHPSGGKPIYSLKGFQRVRLMPGEEKEITFTLTPEMRKQVNEEGESVPVFGLIDVYVGGSLPSERSRDLGSPKWTEAVFEMK